MTQQFTYEEIQKHKDNKSAYILIHNNVYDVTAFLNEVCIKKHSTFVNVEQIGYCDVNRTFTSYCFNNYSFDIIHPSVIENFLK